MDPFLIVCSLHNGLLRELSDIACCQFMGLQQAARHLRKANLLDNATAKRLAHLDYSFNLIRHLTKPGAEQFRKNVVDMVRSRDVPLQAAESADAGSYCTDPENETDTVSRYADLTLQEDGLLEAGSTTGSERIEALPIFFIKTIADQTNATITIGDSGTGMTKNELLYNSGSLAKAGTKAFMETIGVFSSYLGSDKVPVISKNDEEEQYSWEAGAGGTVSVQEDAERVPGEAKRGTKVICHFKEVQPEFMEERRLKDLVKKHSESSGVPLKLYVEKFFASYLVCDKVRVVSKNNDDEQYIWEANAGGTVTVQKDAELVHGEVKRGTRVICYLKEDQAEFLEEWRLKDLIKKRAAAQRQCFLDAILAELRGMRSELSEFA